MGSDKTGTDQMVREFTQKNKRLQDERDDLNGQLKGLINEDERSERGS
jgi:hypothetical protein